MVYTGIINPSKMIEKQFMCFATDSPASLLLTCQDFIGSLISRQNIIADITMRKHRRA